MPDPPPASLPLLDLDAPPRVPMWRLALARKPGLREGQTFGPLAARVRGLSLGDSPRYRELCALPADGPLPLLWAFLAAAPLQKALLLRPEFPVPLLGLVHVSQRVWAARPLDPAEPLELWVEAGQWRPARRGIHVELDTRYLDSDGTLVWWGRTTAWSPHGPGHGQPNPRREPPVFEDIDQQTILVPEGMGRHYGTVAGDRNPIHVHALLARPFGFKRAIVHGMWTVGRCLAALGDRLPTHGVRLRAEFLRPVELPSTGRLSLGRTADSETAEGTGFVWRDGERTCLWGTVGTGGPPA
jgi:acyl dehydratase